MIEKITKDGADVIEVPRRKTSQVISREAADTTTSILQSVVENGTGTPAQAAGRPAAGKTGPAEEDKAAWFAGYTPELATVVAVMGQDPVTAAQKPLYGALGLPRMNGSGPPTAIWAQFTKEALKGEPVTDFDLELQEGADVPQYPTTDPTQGDQGSGDQDNGGTTGDPATGGQDTEGQTGGQTPGRTDGGTTGDTTTGGTTDGGTADGGTTGDTTTGGTTDGGTTGDPGDGGTDTGGTTGDTGDGGTDTGGLGTAGTVAGPQSTARRQ
jgi:membrane peptidoglycan carboxypeptidase